MNITALSPWYGSNRMLASEVGKFLNGCSWVGIPFCGGLCEVGHIKARTIVASDIHRHIINLALCVADAGLKAELAANLEGMIFHEDNLAAAQLTCRQFEFADIRPEPPGDVAWATAYFCACWMARSATAGTRGEFDAGFSVRWEAGGGDSAVRFRNAAAGLDQWHAEFKRCTFVCMDAFEFLDKCQDEPGHAVYADPPFHGSGDKYRHRFSIDDHKRLAARLAQLEHARVVCRFYDCEAIQKLYPDAADMTRPPPVWKWERFKGRKQSNADAPEVLITRN